MLKMVAYPKNNFLNASIPSQRVNFHVRRFARPLFLSSFAYFNVGYCTPDIKLELLNKLKQQL